jgi:hypothetical protein
MDVTRAVDVFDESNDDEELLRRQLKKDALS